MVKDGKAHKSLAVLIDADNTSPRYTQTIFDEIATLGEANVRRIYGDFSATRLASWDSAIKSHAIVQRQQRSNTTGKNAADILLVIDAMDLMYKDKLNGFCLVSSDSDFTRLAQRLREDGLEVYGFGEHKTPEAFRNACNQFIYVENLIGSEEGDVAKDATVSKKASSKKTAQKKTTPKKASPQDAVNIITRALKNCDADDDGWVQLGPVGSWLGKAVPDFDSRNYGCRTLSLLVEQSGGFDVNKEGGPTIRRKPAARKKVGARKKASGKSQ